MNFESLKWFAVTGAHWVVAWFATNGYEGVENVFKFIVWVVFLTTGLVFLASLTPMARKEMTPSERSVPAKLDIAVDIIGALFLAYHGWFWYASMTVMQTLMTESVFRTFAEIRAEAAKNAPKTEAA